MCARLPEITSINLINFFILWISTNAAKHCVLPGGVLSIFDRWKLNCGKTAFYLFLGNQELIFSSGSDSKSKNKTAGRSILCYVIEPIDESECGREEKIYQLKRSASVFARVHFDEVLLANDAQRFDEAFISRDLSRQKILIWIQKWMDGRTNGPDEISDQLNT